MKKLILAFAACAALFAAAPSAKAAEIDHFRGGHRGPVIVVHPGHPGGGWGHRPGPGWGHRPGWGHGGWNHGWDRHHYWGQPWFWVSPGAFVWGAPTMIVVWTDQGYINVPAQYDPNTGMYYWVDGFGNVHYVN